MIYLFLPALWSKDEMHINVNYVSEGILSREKINLPTRALFYSLFLVKSMGTFSIFLCSMLLAQCATEATFYSAQCRRRGLIYRPSRLVPAPGRNSLPLPAPVRVAARNSIPSRVVDARLLPVTGVTRTWRGRRKRKMHLSDRVTQYACLAPFK